MKTLAFCVLLGAASHTANAASTAGCDQVDALEVFVSTDTPPANATCTTFLNTAGEIGVSCYWEFAFRDGSAQSFAASLWTALQRCRDGAEISPDLQVNHPDSYYLKEWHADGNHYGVSVKDKISQRQTLVFFRYQ